MMSELEAQHAMDRGLFLNAGAFRDGEDRRQSPRIPLTQPVRVGPAGGMPQSAVSAADLSTGGLFIDADRPVRVGAKFCVQIPLGNGTAVYVEEAEVVYNRESVHAPGFGVRFIKMDPASQEAIRQEIDRLNPQQLSERPWSVIQDAPTVVPAAFGGQVAAIPSVYEEPSIIEEEAMEVAGNGFISTDVPRSREKPSVALGAWLWRYGRNVGLFLGALAAVTVLTATVVFLWSNAKPVAPSDPVRAAGVPAAETHRNLMEAKTPAAKVVPPPRRPAPRQTAPALGSQILVDPEDVEVDRGQDRFALRVSRGVKVRRSMIYRKPERFVVDLVGQQSPLIPPKAMSGVRRMRVGTHPGFVRVVFDAKRKIKKGRATIDGRRLRISLSYR